MCLTQFFKIINRRQSTVSIRITLSLISPLRKRKLNLNIRNLGIHGHNNLRIQSQIHEKNDFWDFTRTPCRIQIKINSNYLDTVCGLIYKQPRLGIKIINIFNHLNKTSQSGFIILNFLLRFYSICYMRRYHSVTKNHNLQTIQQKIQITHQNNKSPIKTNSKSRYFDRELHPKISQSKFHIRSSEKNKSDSYQNKLIRSLSPSSKSIFQSPKKESMTNFIKQFRSKTSSPPSHKINRKEPYFRMSMEDWDDNFYYSLLDWSYCDLVATANRTQILFFNAKKVMQSQFPVLAPKLNDSFITCIKFAPSSKQLAVGKLNGLIQIFDYAKQQVVSTFNEHIPQRVIAMDWKQHLISGCHKGNVNKRDLRQKKQINLPNILPQMISLRENGPFLAMGTMNSHLVEIYDFRKENTVDSYQHNAAVKAMTWRPGRNQLITGGGSMCRKIKFWNPCEGNYQTINADSQICNLIYAKNSEEFITTHGGGPSGMVKWSGLGIKQTMFDGHLQRAIYAAMSPCGRNVVTGGSDDQVLFWKVFAGIRQQSILNDPLDSR